MMKQETIEQITRIAGFTESTGCIALRADQVKAMLEVAYEAGQRNPHYSIPADNYRLEA